MLFVSPNFFSKHTALNNSRFFQEEYFLLLHFGAVSAKLIHHHFREAVKIIHKLAYMGRALSFVPKEERISNFHPEFFRIILMGRKDKEV